MSSNETDYCPVKQEIKEEADEFMESDEDGSLFISAKLKREDEGSYSMCDRSSEFNNFEKNSPFCPVKKEPEDSSPGPDNLHGVQGTEKLSLKEEKVDIDIEEHKPDWQLIKGSSTSSSNIGMLKDGLVRCESVHQSDSRSSESTREEQAEYNCAHCPYKTNKRSNFIMHYKRRHSTEAEVYFKCEECSYKTKYRHDFSKHYKYKHSNEAGVYKCQVCSFATRTKGHLNEHHKHKHSKDTEMYNCQECSYETKNKSTLTRHYKSKHSTVVEMYKCQECSFETKRKDNFTQHYKWKHLKAAKVYKCEKCSYETINKYHLNKHKKTLKCTNVQNVHLKQKGKIFSRNIIKVNIPEMLKCINVRNALIKQEEKTV